MPAQRDGTPIDWQAWHSDYDDPTSRLSRRLRVVQEHVRSALDAREGSVRIVSMCAGQGRDIIPVIAEHRLRDDATVTLVELDARNAEFARRSAEAAGLRNVTIVRADAGGTDAYASAVPADIFLACGVFGNIPEEEIKSTIEALPSLCAAEADVLWTRYRTAENDVTGAIRAWFGDAGFEEVAFSAPNDSTFAVGTMRMVTAPRPFEPGRRLFTFVR